VVKDDWLVCAVCGGTLPDRWNFEAAAEDGFAKLLTGRHGGRLDAWIEQVQGDDLPYLHSFAVGLTKDHAAVVNGLTMSYSSGPVEGNVNRSKMLKRQMYGRAKFDLLRTRVLHAG
jgi:transposase